MLKLEISVRLLLFLSTRLVQLKKKDKKRVKLI